VQYTSMSQIINSPVVFIGAILLITGIVAFHSLLAKKFGATNASTGRVTIYAIVVTLLLCIATAILAVTILPEIISTLNNGIDIVGLGDVILSTQLFASLIGIFATLVIATLIFSFCVELGAVRSFFTVTLGGLATFVAMLALTPAYESYTLSRQTEASTIRQLASYNDSSGTPTTITSYAGGLQSKRLALQDMGHNICMCENELNCLKVNYANYQKHSRKHAKSYGEDEQKNFLQDLDSKVNNCAASLYALESNTRPGATKPTLEQAIAQYYDVHGKWANTYVLKEIQRVESQSLNADEYIAHVRFRYTPTESSSRHSDGIDNRTFSYQKNQNGSYTVSAMGTADSANFSDKVHEIQASYHPLNTNIRDGSLREHTGRKLKITQLLGAPLEGILADSDANELTIVLNRRDGEISYRLDRTNIAQIEVWY